MLAGLQRDEPGGPIVLAAEHLRGLAVHGDVQQIRRALGGGGEIKGQRVAFLCGHVREHGGGGFIFPDVGGHQHGAAVLLGRDHGPGVLLFGIGEGDSAALDVQRGGELGLVNIIHGGQGGGRLHQRCGLGVEVAQEIVEHAGESAGGGLRADLNHARVAEAIHEHGGGNALGGVDIAQTNAGIAADGEGQTMTLGVLGQYFDGVVGFHRQGDDRDLILILLVGLLQVGELHLAGSAPGGPQVDQHQVLFGQRLGQGEGAAVDGADGEIRNGFAQLAVDRVLGRGGHAAQGQRQHKNQRGDNVSGMHKYTSCYGFALLLYTLWEACQVCKCKGRNFRRGIGFFT